jgi:tetratricopeptide (TPR) repeat protein
MPPHLGPHRSELAPGPVAEVVGDSAPFTSVVENPVPPPPPLPGISSATEKARLFAAGLPVKLVALVRRVSKERYAKIGAGIFAAGVLVGVIGSVVVMMDDDQVASAATPSASGVTAAKPAALAVDAPKPAPLPPPKVDANELAVKRSAPTEAEKPAADEKKKGNAVRQEGSTREAVILPVSGATAPSCQEVLGGNVKKRNAPIAAQKETRLGNRELMLGNVPEAQAAYCKAFAWDRKNIDRHINLGRFFLFRRDWEKAAEFGQSALELDPKNRRALGVVGDAWAALDKPDEARSAWLAAERKSNASQRELSLMVRRNFALAKRVEKLKDFSLAERLYRRVLLLDAKHTGAMKGIASCLLKVGDYQGAEAWARRADMLKRNR